MQLEFQRKGFLKRLTLCGVAVCMLSWPASSWGGYKSQKVTTNPAGSYAFHMKQGSLTIAADPYENWEKLKTVFDIKELDKLGVVPIHLVVTNEGQDSIILDGKEVQLLDKQNRAIESLAAEEVVRLMMSKIDPNPTKKPTPSPLPLPRSKGRQGDWFDIEADLTNKSFRESRIAPHSTVGGFVYFQLPQRQRDISSYKIYIPDIRNSRSGETLLFFEIELK